ncbi:MAG: hypothetical protein DWQ04_10655 [Chloroflexi bacterium]|nr:MAG: hypothetical protein DWQ04_10655 [Chloroflexota bacterium]
MYSSRLMFFLLAVIILSINHSAFSSDLVDNELIELVTVPLDEHTYIDVSVTQKGEVATITGVIDLDIPAGYGTSPGHMDIVIKTQSGIVILIGSVPYQRVNPTGDLRHARFKLSVYKQLPDNSKVILWLHREPMSTHLPLI